MDGKVIAKDAGTITAYGYALDGGLDPTVSEQDYAELMANIATVAQQAAQSAGNASQSATNASQSATDAETAKGTAQQAATDAQTAQASAQGYAQSAQQSAQSASQYAQSAESAKNTALDAVDGFAAGAQQALDSVNQAGVNWKSLAEAQKLDSEAWAVGQRDGEDVGSSDETYHNNAKWYAQQGGSSAQTASDAAQTATIKAGEASASAAAAEDAADRAEAAAEQAEGAIVVDDTLSVEGRAADAEATGKIKSDVNDLKNVLFSKTNAVLETHYATARYRVNNDGLAIVASSLYDITTLIPIDGYMGFSLDYSLTPAAGYGYAPICFFSASSEKTANLVGHIDTVVADYIYSIPIGAKYVGLMVPTGTHLTITRYSDAIEQMKNIIEDLQENINPVDMAKSDSLTTGNSICVTVGNIKKNSVLTFSANFDAFGSLQVGQGQTTRGETAYIVIDDTNVAVYYYTDTAMLWNTYAHGLTLADYIDISITESNSEIGYAKISVTSNGATYTIDRARWQGCNETVYAKSISGTYVNAVLRYTCGDYKVDTWAFGDSYFDHWCTYALADGYNKFLCDGFSGRNSQQALVSLNRLLLHGKPKEIIWCMGMNNGDSLSAVNNDWQSVYNAVKDICSAKKIRFIPCTIPNTPLVNNNYKNAVIRIDTNNYIDLAKAVGSDISTTWYTGLLSSDNVHPSTLGDKMIAKFMESALPQIHN